MAKASVHSAEYKSARLMCVGLVVPKRERCMAEHLNRIRAQVMFPLKQAPSWIQHRRNGRWLVYDDRLGNDPQVGRSAQLRNTGAALRTDLCIVNVDELIQAGTAIVADSPHEI